MFSYVLAAAGALQSPAITDRYDAAARSLDARSECVPFRWEDDGQGNARAAMSVAVQLNGRAMRFQVDTGADTNILYGTAADQAGWSKVSDRQFRPASFRVGATSFDRPYTHILRDMPADGIDGTLGLQALIGRVTVIDYPSQRLCLFAEADLPAAIGGAATWADGALHDGKLFVTASVGGKTWRDVMIDTGSSAMPITVDLERWTRATGRADVEGAPATIEGSSWGKPVRFSGAPMTVPLTLGERVALGQPLMFTKTSTPDSIKAHPYPLDAILGNAALWNGMVVLILTGRTDVGYVR